MSTKHLLVVLLVIAVKWRMSSGDSCPRGCTCDNSGSTVRTAECLVRPKDSPMNVINSMPRDTTTKIRVRAYNKTEAVPWELRRSLLSQFKVLSEFAVPSSGLLTIGSASFVDLSTLTSLDLSDNTLKTIIPGTFTESALLKTLDISQTSLTYLDGFLFRDLNLTLLNLTANFIHDMNDNVFNDSHVQKLDLSHNNITEIRYLQLFPLKDELAYLDLSFNRLTGIGANIFQEFKNLRKLNLSHNLILSISAKIFISPSGEVLPNLEKVSLKNNSIRTFPEDFLKVVNRLTLFDIDGNPLSCNCQLLWLKTNYAGPNLTCEPDQACFLKTECFSNGVASLISDVPTKNFNCTEAKILETNVDDDRISCTVTGDPSPEVWLTAPSGAKIESESKHDGDKVVLTAILNLQSMTGYYSCHAKSYDGKTIERQTPAFVFCQSRHQFFDTGVLVMAIIGTFVGCILVAVSVILWKKCTKRKPRKTRYSTAPVMSMSYSDNSAAAVPRPRPRPPRPGVRVY